jgi:hypothetical protein
MTKLLAVTDTASIFAFGGKSSSHLTASMLSALTIRSVGSTGRGTCARAWLPASSSKVRRLTMVGRMANSHASE